LSHIYDWLTVLAFNQTQQRDNGEPCPPDVFFKHLGYVRLLVDQWYGVELPDALVQPRSPWDMIECLNQKLGHNVYSKWQSAIVQEIDLEHCRVAFSL
jgi:hypothetical protein